MREVKNYKVLDVREYSLGGASSQHCVVLILEDESKKRKRVTLTDENKLSDSEYLTVLAGDSIKLEAIGGYHLDRYKVRIL